MAQQTTTSIPTFVLTPDGISTNPYQVSSLAAAVAHEPRGVYTVARTFHADHALLFDAHLDRLEESARLVNIPLKIDREWLRAAMRELLHQAGYPDAKFRLTVPRETPDLIYFAFERLNPVPEAIMRQGAHVITSPIVRENPVAKTTDWMIVRQPTFNNLPPGVYEAILVSKEGKVLEGLSSNFYGVLDGVLYTANEDVLGGITRKVLLEILPEIVPVHLTALHQDDLPRLSDAMLTSSSRGVVPITCINHQPVGGGSVTPLITAIKDRYDAWTEVHIEPI